MEKSEMVKESLIETGKKLGSGVVGMLIGSAVGRPSLLVGIVTLFGAAWYKYDWLSAAGVGMVASNGFISKTEEQEMQGMDGLQQEIAGAKNRALSSLKALGKKVYLDKFSPSLAEKMDLGELAAIERPMVFVGSEMVDRGSFDTSEVDEIIRQLEQGNPENITGMNVQGFGSPDISELQGYLGSTDITALAGVDELELNAIA
ncbi:hypothetical protein [Nafulsella turpanensis]|uniref:hypothetical protein n=1 Tax=Nafulsella turpanensis TaxID=1265690 RepID=UPI00034D92DA|nr:hypothetical protein [Nafulsella turpanensis]